MYNHRYRPQASNSINKNSSAFVDNGPSINSTSNIVSHRASYQNTEVKDNQTQAPSTVNSRVTPATGLALNTLVAPHEKTAPLNKFGSGSNSYNSNNYRNINTANTYTSPFSSLPKQFVEERQDVVFRRVRGILNKITPETFDKLTRELVNVGLDSPRTLRGVIYLLFDKALKDLKYSSLYAKLCQELSEKAPNFEQEPGPNTFCKFLISKCEDEFDRRRKATEDFDCKNELTDEEFEQKTIAKQKMLGNIKFICELGKKRLLQEEILHECIRGLLSKKKKERPIQDQAQDLECLCQIMRTIGSLLDVVASRNLMNQYFDRIEMYSKKPELPSRIRFMLKDVIDLRNNNWRPRPFQREDVVPQPLSKIRGELGLPITSPISSVDKLGNKNLINIGDLSKLTGDRLNSLLLDDEPSFTTTTDFHWGSTFLPDDPNYDIFSNDISAMKNLESKITEVNKISVQKSVDQPQRPLIPSINPMTPLNQPTTAIINNVKQRVQRNVDPFIERPSPRSNIQSNSNHLDRRPNHIDETNHPRRNDIPRISPPRSRIPPRTSVSRHDDPTVLNQGLSDRHSRRDNTNHNHVRMNEPILDPRSINNIQSNSHIRNHIFKETNRSSLPHDVANEESQSQLKSVVLKHQENSPRLGTSDNVSMEHSRPSPHNLNESRSRASRPDIDRQHQLNTTGNHHINNFRDRRFNRNNIERHEVRQPRFSGSNYRLPGRDRLQAQAPQKRDRVLDAESSSNWRADSAACQSKNIEIQAKNAPQVERAVSTVHSQVKTVSEPDSQQSSPIEKDIDKLELKPPINDNKQMDLPNMSVISNANLDLESQRFTQPAVDKPVTIKQDLNDRQQHPEMRPVNDRLPRRMQDSRQGNHPSQSRRQMPIDRKDTPRKPPGPLIEFDGRVFQRPYQNESSSLERRNFKSPMARNQSFEVANKAEPPRKGPNWRKDAPINNSAPSMNKDETINIPNPLIHRGLMRLADSDFSLRPSHNLNGRVPSSMSSQSLVNTVPTTPPVTTIHAPDNLFNTSDKHGSGQDMNREVKQAAPERAIKKSVDSVHDKFVNVFSDLYAKNPQDLQVVSAKIKELKVPRQYQSDCLTYAMKQTIVRTEDLRSNASKIFAQIVPSSFDLASLVGACHTIFEELHGMEVETPKIKSIIAGLLSQLTTDGLLTIEDVSGMLVGGKHHPLFLLYLQKLDKINGKSWLIEKFTASRVNLMQMLPEVDRSNDRLASALKDRCLGFLDPMLTIEPDLWEQMRNPDLSPTVLYRWIKENVDNSIQNTSTFAYVFVRCLVRYVYETSMAKVKASGICSSANDMANQDESQSNKPSPTNAVLQSLAEYEKESLIKYQSIMQAVLKNKSMQLTALYAVQAFYHGLDFPKGALLRLFHSLYDLSIVDDDVYFIWKEEINDKYPGKGQALFQVNTWLHWLAEAESEEDDDED